MICSNVFTPNDTDVDAAVLLTFVLTVVAGAVAAIGVAVVFIRFAGGVMTSADLFATAFAFFGVGVSCTGPADFFSAAALAALADANAAALTARLATELVAGVTEGAADADAAADTAAGAGAGTGAEAEAVPDRAVSLGRSSGSTWEKGQSLPRLQPPWVK